MHAPNRSLAHGLTAAPVRPLTLVRPTRQVPRGTIEVSAGRGKGASPKLTVIVPAYQCAEQLTACLEGLDASDLPRTAWELIVVDDGSTDDTHSVALRSADTVLRVADGPRGPAHARNTGARAAHGSVLVFVDADVVVSPTTLAGFAARFDADASLTAAFGAYDNHPADRGLVSQYRNLLHHYVHTRHAGDALTFWTGCGAVRRDAFMAVGGFDAERYPRPQVEDIELGYRLKDQGARIELVPSLTGTHLKRWSLAGMLRMDLRDRAVPWMRLLLDRREALTHGELNLAPWEKVFTATAPIAIGSLFVAIAAGSATWAWVTVACTLFVLVGNLPLFSFFAATNGWGFALRTIPLRLAFYGVSAVGASWAMLSGGWQARSMSAASEPVSVSSEWQ